MLHETKQTNTVSRLQESVQLNFKRGLRVDGEFIEHH